MNSPLRLFLMTRKRASDWKICVSQRLDEVVETWSQLSSEGDIVGVIHVGFGRPTARSFNDLAEKSFGRVLATNGAKFVLPKSFKCSEYQVADVDGTAVYLALEGWGYTIEDPTVGLNANADETRRHDEAGGSSVVPPARGWVSQFLAIAPVFQEALVQAKIFDEDSYLEHEGTLDVEVRTAMGQFRFDFLVCDKTDPLDIVRSAPPWLRSLEVGQLPLTVRLGNVFNQNNIRIVSDLDEFSGSALFRLKNFGRHSKKHLAEALEKSLRRGLIDRNAALEDVRQPPDKGMEVLLEDSNEEPTAVVTRGLVGNLLTTLNELEERKRQILLGRMGFSEPPKTLEELGSIYGVTRERVRQIEKATLETIVTEKLWDDVMRHRLSSILASRNEPLPLFGLEVVDEWFRGTARKQDVLAYLVDNVCETRFNILKVGTVKYISRLDQETWDGKLREARKLLESAVDLNWSEGECEEIVRSLLPREGKELEPLIWSEASRLCHFSGTDDSRTLTAYGRGIEQFVQVVLEGSPKPLHTSEVAELVGELSGKEITESQVRSSVAKAAFLLGPGTYGLRKHIPLSDLELGRAVEIVTELIADESQGRQWHTSELVPEIQEADQTIGDKLDKYLLNAALELKSELTYLGRLVWTQTDSHDQHRVDIRDAVIGILESAGGPLTTREINERLSEIRGVNTTFQLWSRDPILRAGRGLWGLNDRDFLLKRSEQPILADKIASALRRKGSGIHLEEIRDYVEDLPLMDAEAIFSLAALDERIALGTGGFAYLKDWGEPRRSTLTGALNKLRQQVPGPMHISDIKDWLEFITERKIDKKVVSHALSQEGITHLGDGIWEIIEPNSIDDIDEH